MDIINITSAKYEAHPEDGTNTGVVAVINGKKFYVPIEVGNRHYDEIMRQVSAGTLTIQDAD